MAENARGNTALAGQHGANLQGSGPPPSTLAAQLVENISTSAKSSRSDDGNELKGLFATIQQIKDHPEMLKSPQDRVEHNHMLIYVYCRVALEAIKLDDPFLNRTHAHAEALKAINFLRFTIKETPSVLNYTHCGDTLLHRGRGPLWAWLLPQLLRLLGHGSFEGLDGSLEGFFQYILLVVSRADELWFLAPSLVFYLRACLTGVMERLQNLSVDPSTPESFTPIRLPNEFATSRIIPDVPVATYSIVSPLHALRHVSSLSKVLAYPVISPEPVLSCISVFSQPIPWLLDFWLDLRNVQRKWELLAHTSPAPIIATVLDCVDGFRVLKGNLNSLDAKAHALLVLLCGEMVASPQELLHTSDQANTAQLVFCRALIAITKISIRSYSIGRMVASKLVQELSLLATQNPSIGDGTDIGRCTRTLHHVVFTQPQQLLDRNMHPTEFLNTQLRHDAEGLNLQYEQTSERTVTKRRKVSNSASEPLSILIASIHETLEMPTNKDAETVLAESFFLKKFAEATEGTQCLALELLSRVSCISDAPSEESQSTAACRVCDARSPQKTSKVTAKVKDSSRQVFSKLIQSATFLESRRPRIVAMIALRRIAAHCEDDIFMDLESSAAGQWCLQSLNSSLRELRVAAGRTLTAFMKAHYTNGADGELIDRNRKNLIALLKSTSDQDPSHLIETRVMAWGQIGRVASDSELNLVLIKFFDYLGSSNNIVSSFAFNELLNLADHRNMTPRRLLEPYWRSLAYLATKDMVHRPQRSRALGELLQVSVSDLLLLIQTHALPWLVLDKQQDVIQKITEARKESDAFQTLMEGSNLASTVALLLTQDAYDVEKFAKSRLDSVSPKFQSMNLLQLFQSEPVLIALELLKASANADDGGKAKAQAHQALLLMSKSLLSANKETKSKKTNLIGRCLKSYVLGLMARVTEVFDEPTSAPIPLLEQKSCLRTLEEMIKICKEYARDARPQMSACLLFTISQHQLREASLSCWASMLMHLEDEDVEVLLETTLFIVRRYWDDLDATSKYIAQTMLRNLLDNHSDIVEKHANKLPSLSECSGLYELSKRLNGMRQNQTMTEALNIFSQRLVHDNSGVVYQALIELVPFLHEQQNGLYSSIVSQRPDSAITTALRALLDCACKYNGVQTDISRLCVQCIGLIGCLDSNQVETVREQRSIVVLDNFEAVGEATDFGLFLLEEVLVPSFLSATDTRLQGFLSYAIQELLERCDIKAAVATTEAPGAGRSSGNEIYRKWIAVPAAARNVMMPFLSSRYSVAPMPPVTVEYPIFRLGKPYANWIRSFVMDLLHKGQNDYATLIFEPLMRVIRIKDLSTAEFLLPYLVLHVLIGPISKEDERSMIVEEILAVLRHQPTEDAPEAEREEMKRFCHAIFRCLDYAMRWIQEKRASGRLSSAGKETVARIQAALDGIPASLVSERASDCNEHSRALFHLEQHALKMEQQKREPEDRDKLLKRLQDIYANIDEPDGLEGISAHLHSLDLNQQILSHKKAGRWAAAQTWYEMELAKKPDNTEVQVNLLQCLKQAGQHDVLLNHIEGMQTDTLGDAKIMPFAAEAAWVTRRWDSLEKFTSRFPGNVEQDFNMSIAALFDSLYNNREPAAFQKTVRSMREKIASSMTTSATASLNAAHDVLLKCHILTDLEMIVSTEPGNDERRKDVLATLDGRLEVIGGRFGDKQYLLGIRRAAMELSKQTFGELDISGLWLSTARLARKTSSLNQSFNAVLHASMLGDDAATIENAKLLWRDNQHRKAIQMLQGAIESNKFMTQPGPTIASSAPTKLNSHQKLLTARAQLLLAKWLDSAGQSHAGALRERYQQPPRTHSTWEKGHYYLGRHYKKILESEKPLKADDQSDNYVTGEIARLVIENYVRSLNSGTKYLYQTLPRILTLWLDLGAQVDKPPEGKMSLSRELHRRRIEQLNLLHTFLDKYIGRLPTYIFYTALPQIVARIAHPHVAVFERLTHIITKVVEAHPRQALWSLIGIMTTKQMSERKTRGTQILTALRGVQKRVEGTNHDLKYLIKTGEKLAEQLLFACQNGDFQGNKAVHASLSRDLRFQHKCTPCPLVVPVESTLTATLPALSEQVKKHKAFSRDVVTIQCFLDDVLVLSSLAKPRRLTARGSDGKNYMLLIKPKDDLRTDQRLMEFNGIINRSLKRDAESSRRQLYIRTYAVVPLNEECGIIEWVPGIKTMRDILLTLYGAQKITPDYPYLRQQMDEASSSESKIRIFTDDVLGRFPPLLPMWFIQQFPNPSAWFAARLNYTRSCAVTSMVGTILGLGDRHGENVNLEEGNGGIFHVDFNCLFDKGLTFAKPERVPFRLTHNMVAAMGVYGYEGPFRKSSELTLSILRQQEETLMTILEAFIYDPTLDLQKEKKSSRRGDSAVRLQPQSVVDSIRRKVRGLLANESIPLSVEGQVDELIKQAVDPRNLTAMYIGWCPFL